MLVSLLKELSLVNLSNKLLRKILFIILLSSSSAAQALTMGDFVVNSFLDKELQAEIIVDGDSGDNLNSIDVSIADQAEFDQAGILRSPLLDQFEFKLVKLSDNKVKILVTTENEVTEPYIHMLLKIRWNGGQLLREFTALIDPPLFSSTPAEPVSSPRTTADKEAELKDELNGVTSSQSETGTASVATSQPSGTLSEDSYGPVQAGESLSEIALKIQANNPDLSIYQIMYVLFQNNQSAFIGENINNLAKGATLKVGDLSTITQIDKQEGVNFFYSQLAEWSAKNDSNVATKSVSESTDDSGNSSGSESSDVASDSEQVEEEINNQEPIAVQAEPQELSTAEENPEFQVAGSDVQNNAQESGDANNQVVTGLKDQIAELEASVESTKLENEELKEQISLLKTQLADSERLIEINNQQVAALIEDNTSSDQDSSTAEATTPDTAIPDVATPNDEASDTPADQTEAGIDTEIAEPLGEIPAPEVEAEPQVQAEPEPAPEPEKVEEPEPAPEPQKVEVPEPAPVVAQPSIVETILDSIKRFWKFLAIGLVGILAILYWKVRSSGRKEDGIDAFESTFTVYPDDTEIPVDDSASDAKAEELINAIKAESTKVEDVVSNPAVEESPSETSVVSSIDMNALRDATQSVTDFDVDAPENEITKESSFLTVYNDGDVVVNSDEIDPIAEADVYIAYGREDQGEEVLLDGVKNFPDRNDIKIALLGLYAKSSKKEKFDETYQSLVDNGVENNAEEFEAVKELKNTIYSTNEKKNDNTVTNSLDFEEEASNTDFLVSNDEDLSEIDIKSESFDISEIDFSSDTEENDIPVLSNEFDDVAVAPEIEESIDIDAADSGGLSDEITIDFEEVDNQIDSNTIEVESITIEVGNEENFSSATDPELNAIVDKINAVELSSGAEEVSENISSLEEEISQIDFETDGINEEKTLQIDFSGEPGSITDAVDITAEISEISFDDEVSLTDVMELNVNEVDLTSIPDDQDLSPTKDTMATALMNDVDFVDEEDSILQEVTVDLTETVEVDETDVFGDIDLDLGGATKEGALPDGDNDPQTQLDLAKVFLELDDVNGAVKILKELTESPLVGEEAKELLKKNS